MEYFDTSNFKGPVKVLQNGEVLALPTETVYGLAVRADSKAAFDRLVATKNRKPDKPFALAFDCLASALPYLEIDKRAKAVMEKFLPGQLTVLVKAKNTLPWHVTLGTGVVGVRIPDDPYVSRLLHEVGVPCLLTSANLSGQPTSRTYEEALRYFDGKIGGIVKGQCVSKIPTTIVDLSKDNQLTLVRQGALSFDNVKAVWEVTK